VLAVRDKVVLTLYRIIVKILSICTICVLNSCSFQSSGKSVRLQTIYTERPIMTFLVSFIVTFFSIVKPTRDTSISKLFYFGMTLYMFRTVFTSIIRSSRLYIQQQEFVKQVLLSACYPLASREQYLFDIYTFCCMYSLELLMMDGKTVRNM